MSSPAAVVHQRERIASMIERHPELSDGAIAVRIGCSTSTVCRCRKRLAEGLGPHPPASPRQIASRERNLRHLSPQSPAAASVIVHSKLVPRIDELADEIRQQVAGYTAADDLAVKACATAAASVEALVRYIDSMASRRSSVSAAAKLLQPALNSLRVWCNELGLSPAARHRMGMTRAPGEPRESTVLTMAREAEAARTAWENAQESES